MTQLFVGLMTEGSTDYRFLMPIIENTLLTIAIEEIEDEIEVQIFKVAYKKEGGFKNYVFSASKNGFQEFGIMWLIVHTDADSLDSKNAYQHKINPSVQFILNHEDTDICKEIVPLVPVYETESWLLANKNLFKKWIGTKKSDLELGIERHPESISRPKEIIEEAIRIGRQDLPPKIRNKIGIEDIYSILGDHLTVDDLSRFISFQDFRNNIRTALINMNLLN
jgi:hypothetical protein